MADFGSGQPAPQGNGSTSKAPVDQGGAPKSGISEAPVGADEQGNFGPGDGVRPGGIRIH